MRWSHAVAEGAEHAVSLHRHVHFDRENTAFADSAFDPNSPAHQLNQPLRHHQANTGALLRCGLFAQSVEWLKQMRNFFSGQTRARIFDGNAHAPSRNFCATHTHRAAYVVVFDRVGEQVDQHLLHASAIRLHHIRKCELFKGDGDSAFLRLRLDHGLTFKHDLC